MEQTNLNWITNYIWGIGDDVLHDTEQIPLTEEGGIAAFIKREVLPHAPRCLVVESSIKVGYEVSFTRYFYKPLPMRVPSKKFVLTFYLWSRRPRVC